MGWLTRRRFKTIALAVILPVAAQLPLSGCAQGGMGDVLPQALGGLPDGAPKPPTQSYKYPNVYGTQPERPDAPLDDQQQLNLQKDLQKLRDQHQTLSADPTLPPPEATTPAPAKKKAAAPKTGQGSGAKANP
ncbi:MAG: hypothetical protein JSR61_08510 [Proteobacteria bacterium]|nr:hypothetical protein [Pseudomonadota bacterium]